jgi:hypothetical protein
MDRRLKGIGDVSEEVLGPLGIKHKIVHGKSHPHVELLVDGKRVSRVKFSASPRTDNRPFYRQSLLKELKRLGLIGP